jgi:hypothetical protein
MRAVFGGSIAGARKIGGQDLRSVPATEQVQQDQPERLDKSVRPVTRINGQRISFGDLARFAWPNKTEANLAFHLKVDPRTARRWLADDNEPPADALGVILSEIMRRFHQR